MKLIGLLGGTSWPSTIEYYRILNELAQSRLGGFHSANLLLRSIDYHAIKSRYHAGSRFRRCWRRSLKHSRNLARPAW